MLYRNQFISIKIVHKGEIILIMLCYKKVDIILVILWELLRLTIPHVFISIFVYNFHFLFICVPFMLIINQMLHIFFNLLFENNQIVFYVFNMNFIFFIFWDLWFFFFNELILLRSNSQIDLNVIYCIRIVAINI